MRSLTKAVAVTAAPVWLSPAAAAPTAATPEATGSGSTGGSRRLRRDSLIGVALPQKTSENWVLAEKLFNEGLTAAGFKGDVQFANGGVSEQQNQIQAMVTKGAKVIVVGAIDGSQLGTQLKAAKDSGATVIAYDRLLKNTADVDYYVAYDNFKVGQLQGQALLDGLEGQEAPARTTSSCSPVRLTTTTPRSSSTAP
jgi:putative multiple sugar transport system substrate-binding protein